MGLCYYALGWRKVPRLETTTVTYYHSENTMNKGFDNIGAIRYKNVIDFVDSESIDYIMQKENMNINK